VQAKICRGHRNGRDKDRDLIALLMSGTTPKTHLSPELRPGRPARWPRDEAGSLQLRPWRSFSLVFCSKQQQKSVVVLRFWGAHVRLVHLAPPSNPPPPNFTEQWRAARHQRDDAVARPAVVPGRPPQEAKKTQPSPHLCLLGGRGRPLGTPHSKTPHPTHGPPHQPGVARFSRQPLQ